MKVYFHFVFCNFLAPQSSVQHFSQSRFENQTIRRIKTKDVCKKVRILRRTIPGAKQSSSQHRCHRQRFRNKQIVLILHGQGEIASRRADRLLPMSREAGELLQSRCRRASTFNSDFRFKKMCSSSSDVVYYGVC